jgi:hypothetical protein
MRRKTTTRKLGEVCEDQTDWGRVDAQTEEELAEAIRTDPDDEELEPGWVKRAMVVRPAHPEERVTTWEGPAIAAAIIKDAVFFPRA